jgi:hypothetical protein
MTKSCGWVGVGTGCVQGWSAAVVRQVGSARAAATGWMAAGPGAHLGGVVAGVVLDVLQPALGLQPGVLVLNCGAAGSGKRGQQRRKAGKGAVGKSVQLSALANSPV